MTTRADVTPGWYLVLACLLVCLDGRRVCFFLLFPFAVLGGVVTTDLGREHQSEPAGCATRVQSYTALTSSGAISLSLAPA